MEENIRFTVVLRSGTAIPCNVKSRTVFDAAREIEESILAGDLKVRIEDVVAIVDIPG